MNSPATRQPSQPARPPTSPGSARTGRPNQAQQAKQAQITLLADWTPTAGGTETDASAVPLSSATAGPATSVAAATASWWTAGQPRAEAAPAEAEEAGPLSAAAAPAEETAEWSPADWVPDWANEASEPAASGISHGVTSHARTGQTDTSPRGTSQADTGQAGASQTGAIQAGNGQAGNGRAADSRLRLAAGLRDRLAGARQAKATLAPAAGRHGRYERPLPRVVRNAFQAMAQGPLLGAEPLYRDVAGHIGLPWELLAACDWMQCEAKSKHSPVHGEKLGTHNPDGSVYWTRSAALEQCAEDLVELANTVYGIDLTRPEPLSVQELANAFAAFRWGGLLKAHHTSAMEFPYSVAGLTVQHISMRWPSINDPNAPDKPGGRFRMHFGAVPVLLSLEYPATA